MKSKKRVFVLGSSLPPKIINSQDEHNGSDCWEIETSKETSFPGVKKKPVMVNVEMNLHRETSIFRERMDNKIDSDQLLNFRVVEPTSTPSSQIVRRHASRKLPFDDNSVIYVANTPPTSLARSSGTPIGSGGSSSESVPLLSKSILKKKYLEEEEEEGDFAEPKPLNDDNSAVPVGSRSTPRPASTPRRVMLRSLLDASTGLSNVLGSIASPLVGNSPSSSSSPALPPLSLRTSSFSHSSFRTPRMDSRLRGGIPSFFLTIAKKQKFLSTVDFSSSEDLLISNVNANQQQSTSLISSNPATDEWKHLFRSNEHSSSFPASNVAHRGSPAVAPPLFEILRRGLPMASIVVLVRQINPRRSVITKFGGRSVELRELWTGDDSLPSCIVTLWGAKCEWGDCIVENDIVQFSSMRFKNGSNSSWSSSSGAARCSSSKISQFCVLARREGGGGGGGGGSKEGRPRSSIDTFPPLIGLERFETLKVWAEMQSGLIASSPIHRQPQPQPQSSISPPAGVSHCQISGLKDGSIVHLLGVCIEIFSIPTNIGSIFVTKMIDSIDSSILLLLPEKVESLHLKAGTILDIHFALIVSLREALMGLPSEVSFASCFESSSRENPLVVLTSEETLIVPLSLTSSEFISSVTDPRILRLVNDLSGILPQFEFESISTLLESKFEGSCALSNVKILPEREGDGVFPPTPILACSRCGNALIFQNNVVQQCRFCGLSGGGGDSAFSPSSFVDWSFPDMDIAVLDGKSNGGGLWAECPGSVFGSLLGGHPDACGSGSGSGRSDLLPIALNRYSYALLEDYGRFDVVLVSSSSEYHPCDNFMLRSISLRCNSGKKK